MSSIIDLQSEINYRRDRIRSGIGTARAPRVRVPRGRRPAESRRRSS